MLGVRDRVTWSKVKLSEDRFRALGGWVRVPKERARSLVEGADRSIRLSGEGSRRRDRADRLEGFPDGLDDMDVDRVNVVRVDGVCTWVEMRIGAVMGAVAESLVDT
jgi:hypothetical protein